MTETIWLFSVNQTLTFIEGKK